MGNFLDTYSLEIDGRGFDDGIYAGLRIIEILSNNDKKCSELLEGMNKYYSTEELKFEANDNIKFEIVEKVKQYCEEKKYEIITLDGVRATFNDGWALVSRLLRVHPLQQA